MREAASFAREVRAEDTGKMRIEQAYRPIVCPYCGSGDVRVRAVKPFMRYYQCLEEAPRCDLERRGGTYFKVRVIPNA